MTPNTSNRYLHNYERTLEGRIMEELSTVTVYYPAPLVITTEVNIKKLQETATRIAINRRLRGLV